MAEKGLPNEELNSNLDNILNSVGSKSFHMDDSVSMDENSAREAPYAENPWTRRKVLGAGFVLLVGGVIADEILNESKVAHYFVNKILGQKVLESNSRIHFPYSFSPWVKYAELEQSLLEEFEIPEEDIPRHADKIISIGDEISDNVANRVLWEADAERFVLRRDVNQFIGDFPRVDLMKIIAEEIANYNIIYHGESLISRSFDSKVHAGNFFHLDCDLIAYLMAHICMKLDVEMYTVSGPLHCYLTVSVPGENSSYVIEPTEFRRIEERKDRRGRVVSVNYKGEGIGAGFFSTWKKQKKHGGLRTTEEFERDAKLHTKITDEQRVQDNILGNILAGLMDYADRKDNLDLKLKIYSKALNAIERGTDAYLLISNFYTNSIQLTEEYIRIGQFNHAEITIRNAFWIRELRNELITNGEPVEKVLECELYLRKGDNATALVKSNAVREIYRERGKGQEFLGGSRNPRARNHHHAKVLTYIAEIELGQRFADKRQIYNQLLMPAFNCLSQYGDKSQIDEYNWVKAKINELGF